jgi:hypothetical protein
VPVSAVDVPMMGEAVPRHMRAANKLSCRIGTQCSSFRGREHLDVAIAADDLSHIRSFVHLAPSGEGALAGQGPRWSSYVLYNSTHA